MFPRWLDAGIGGRGTHVNRISAVRRVKMVVGGHSHTHAYGMTLKKSPPPNRSPRETRADGVERGTGDSFAGLADQGKELAHRVDAGVLCDPATHLPERPKRDF